MVCYRRQYEEILRHGFDGVVRARVEIMRAASCIKVRANTFLSCQVYIRSNDLFLGQPYNIASHSMLTYIIAKMTDPYHSSTLALHAA